MDSVIFIALALALGFKHSYDADHLVAVSNLLTRSQSLRRTSLMSVSWAAGHMATATVITILLYTFRETLLHEFLDNFELAVAIMLIVIGVLGLLYEFGLLHRHPHAHPDEGSDGKEHVHAHAHGWNRREHRAMFSIGIVHGLASNDELLILFVSALSVTTLAGLILGVAGFSAGVVIRMISFGLALTRPLGRGSEKRVRRAVTLIAGTLSILYGALILLGFGGV